MHSLSLDTSHHRTENVEAAQQRNIITDIVTLHMKKFSAPNKHKYELGNSGMVPGYAGVRHLIRVQDNPQ